MVITQQRLGNTAILVLGMHRSGTSAVTGVLSHVGVELGPHLGSPLPDNPKGFFEHTDVVGVHEELLAALGTAWDDPRSLPPGWHRDPAVAPFRAKLAAVVVRDFAASRLWAVKDPRLCRTLPLWLDVLAELEVEVKAVLVGRDPGSVAASLRVRNAIDTEQSTMLWLSYVLGSEVNSRSLPRTIVLYDDLLANWEAEIERLGVTLGLELAAFSPDIRAAVAGHLDAELRHHRDAVAPAPRAPQNAWATPVFEALVAWRRNAIPPLSVCDEAAAELARAEAAAEPVARYVRFKARTDHDAELRAELDASVEARRQLQLELIAQADARAEDGRLAGEAAAREAQLRQQLDVQARTQIKLVAEASAAQAALHRAEAAAAAEAHLRSQAVADSQSAAAAFRRRIGELERLLREIQGSHSWRLTRPIRIGFAALRDRLRRRNRRASNVGP
jgi:hypothetical protein